MPLIGKSKKLHGICYDIRGPVLDHAVRLEDAGSQILKLNIGNPGAHGGFNGEQESHCDKLAFASHFASNYKDVGNADKAGAKVEEQLSCLYRSSISPVPN